MAHETDTLHFNVTLVGTPRTASVQAAEAELDELVQDSIELLDNPDEMVPLIRAIRRGVKPLVHHKRPSRAARSFLTGVVPLERSRDADLEAASHAIALDFVRRDNVVRESLSAAAAAKLIGVTRQAVNNRWKSGKLLGFIVNGNVLFPSWQFDAKAPESVVEGLDEVLLILAERDRSTLDQIFWLTSPRPEFDDASPIEALRHGKKDAVAAQARGAGVS